MSDDLTVRRQLRCAKSRRGHAFGLDGKCKDCDLVVYPPKEEKEDRRDA